MTRLRVGDSTRESSPNSPSSWLLECVIGGKSSEVEAESSSPIDPGKAIALPPNIAPPKPIGIDIGVAGEGEAAGDDGVAVISAPGSAIPVLVIPTDEEQAIARLTWELTRG